MQEVSTKIKTLAPNRKEAVCTRSCSLLAPWTKCVIAPRLVHGELEHRESVAGLVGRNEESLARRRILGGDDVAGLGSVILRVGVRVRLRLTFKDASVKPYTSIRTYCKIHDIIMVCQRYGGKTREKTIRNRFLLRLFTLSECGKIRDKV